ncbi:hypothetical protein A0W34_30335 (plasmid) [Rhodococcus sp. BH4]|uniref:hypothetical protein n=1 Tax=Rhodococcus sp. BH4 TaxID=1807790 RepID=UPI0009C36ADD|nr:hypothetical protein [Rhodococcus sp. BH4]ARE37821.1 hypothetical protein A0W34_30335 [Rhodococcus sp. BH4]
MEDSILYDLPTEFFADMAASSGYCDAQSILPVEGKYLCHCTCGAWDIETPDRDTGLALARAHTAQTDVTR